MVRMPVLCPACHNDRVMTGGTITAGAHHSPCQNAACPHDALPRDGLDTGRRAARHVQSVARRPNGVGGFGNRSACGLPVDNRTGHLCNTTVHSIVGRRKTNASPDRTGIHHGTPRAPARGVDRWRAGAGCDHPSGLAQRGPLRGGPLRYATCPGAVGGDDVPFAHHRPTRGPVVPGAPEYRRPGAPPPHDGPLGLGQLRDDGALAGLPQRAFYRLGWCRRLLRPESPRVQAQRAHVLRIPL
jgi:hypothetical protein